MSDTFCGSLSYVPPEILKGIWYDPKVSDMWSYGVLLFTMLNKAVPFDDKHITVGHETLRILSNQFIIINGVLPVHRFSMTIR